MVGSNLRKRKGLRIAAAAAVMMIGMAYSPAGISRAAVERAPQVTAEGEKHLNNAVTDWSSYFYSHVSEVNNTKYLVLEKYIGTEKSLYIPKTYTKDGITYKVTFASSTERDNYSPWFETNVESISFESGFVLPEDCNALFAASNLKSISFTGVDSSAVNSMDYMFYGAQVKSLDLSGFKTTNLEYMDCTFAECDKLETLNISSFDTSNVFSMYETFKNCGELKNITMKKFATENVFTMCGLFEGCSSLESIDLTYFNTENTENMYHMFKDCSSLKSLDLSGFRTSRVNTAMDGMFAGCTGLTTLDISSFNMRNVPGTAEMFDGCTNLKTLTFGNANTNYITSTSKMFRNCSSLESLDISDLNLEKVVDTSEMFSGCEKLKTIRFGTAWNGTPELNNINEMFCGCGSLTSLNLENFSLKSLKVGKDEYGYQNVFFGCDALETIYTPTFLDSSLNMRICFGMLGEGYEGFPDQYLNYRDGTGKVYYYLPSGLKTSRKLVLMKPAVITVQPESKSVICGNKTKISVEMTGDDISYKWEVSANGGKTWVDSKAPGADTNAITIDVTSSLNGRLFRCLGYCSYTGAVISKPVSLNALPIISADPENVALCDGSTASFKVKARAKNAVYLWQFSTDNGKTWKNSSASGCSTAEIKFKALEKQNGYKFRCKVTNGAVTEYSKVAKLNVTSAIKTQPKDTTAYYGDKAVFKVVCSGSGIKYQWQVLGSSGKWVNSSAAGNKTASLSLTATSGMNGKVFRCLVTIGGVEYVTKSATLKTVNNIITQPAAKTVKDGKKAVFSVKAGGSNLSYKWQVSTNGGKTWVDTKASGYNTSALTVTAKAKFNGYKYKCIVTNGTAVTESKAATLTVK